MIIFSFKSFNLSIHKLPSVTVNMSLFGSAGGPIKFGLFLIDQLIEQSNSNLIFKPSH